MEYFTNHFEFLVLGLVLTACLFFGVIAWMNAIKKGHKLRKAKFNRKIDAIREATAKIKAKSESTKPPLDYPGASFRSRRHDSAKTTGPRPASRPSSVSHSHSHNHSHHDYDRYDNSYQRSAIPAYALLADDSCNRSHSSPNDHSPSRSSSCSSFSSDSGSSDSSSSSCD